MILLNERIRGVAAIPLLFLMCLTAHAYTVVLRDGRKVEIPDSFLVGRSTLTYEAGPTIQFTLQLSTVDIAATEKANNEVAGSLLKRAFANGATRALSQSTSSARTVTNLDLESFRNRRLAGEAEYEKRRKELGLPSVEESRRAAAIVGERTHEQLVSAMQEDQQAESYWRVRASELRAELAAVNGRINLVQTRLNALPLNYSFGGFVGVPNFVSVNQLSRGVAFPTVFLNGKVSGPIRRGGLSMGFGNTQFHGRVGFDNFQRRGFNRRGFLPPFGSLVALPFDAYDSSFERATLLTELNQLLSQRAGLQSRWRSLEDDARRSGAYPGWLR